MGLANIPLEHLEHILDNLKAGIVIADASGTVLWANQYYEDITGIPIKNYIEKHTWDIQMDENITYIDTNETLFQTVMREKKDVKNVLKYNTTDYIITNTGPIYDDAGNVLYVLYTLTNFNEISRIQQELASVYARISSMKSQMQSLQLQELTNSNIIIHDKKMQQLYTMATKLASSSISVMLLGETGVGKDVMAKYIHKISPRKNGTFVHVNLGAIPKPLFESELFGYAPGAFTGASIHGKEGVIRLADRGTLFLDEVGELPLDIQAKLLQVIQDKAVRRVGDSSYVPVDVRIISATNRNLEEMVAQGTFRLDLYYRLNVVDLHIPPLRERKADIPLLAAHFLKQFNHTYKTQRVLAPDTLNLLLQYQWPGNVRELCHTIESLVALADGNVILPSMLPPEISGFYAQTYHTSPVSPNASMSLKEAVANLETQMIQHALSTHHTLTSAAASLQLDTSTLIKKKKKYGL